MRKTITMTLLFMAGLMSSCKKELNASKEAYVATFYCDEGLNCNTVEQVLLTFEYTSDSVVKVAEAESNTTSELSLKDDIIEGSIWVTGPYWVSPKIIGRVVREKGKTNINGRYSALTTLGDWVYGDFIIEEQ